MEQPLIKLLAEHLRKDQIVVSDDVSERYKADWGDSPPCTPNYVLLPESSEDVSNILKICHSQKQPVVVQGGMTGLAGAATPQQGEISLSLERLTGIEEIDTNGLSMRVLAGTTLGEIHRQLEETNYVYGVDYGARDMAQIGGNIATNAGGTQVIRYGMSRAQVLGLEAVLADGTVLSSMNTLLKNNAGYDLKHLFIGTEGTLGVVTKLQLRIFPRPTSCCAALFAIDDYENCLVLLRLCRGIFAESLTAFEVMWKPYYDAACDSVGSQPFDSEQNQKIYTLVEVQGQNQELDFDRLRELFQQCLDEDIIQLGVLAESEEDTEQLWNVRFAVKLLLKTMPALANFDIGIPATAMQSFVDQVTLALTPEFPGIDILAFGHIGDGNVHLLVSTGKEEDVEAIYEKVYPLCRSFNGTITAEHGVGVHKKGQLQFSRTDAEMNLMRTLKLTLDPQGILNPGRVFDVN